MLSDSAYIILDVSPFHAFGLTGSSMLYVSDCPSQQNNRMVKAEWLTANKALTQSRDIIPPPWTLGDPFLITFEAMIGNQQPKNSEIVQYSKKRS